MKYNINSNLFYYNIERKEIIPCEIKEYIVNSNGRFYVIEILNKDKNKFVKENDTSLIKVKEEELMEKLDSIKIDFNKKYWIIPMFETDNKGIRIALKEYYIYEINNATIFTLGINPAGAGINFKDSIFLGTIKKETLEQFDIKILKMPEHPCSVDKDITIDINIKFNSLVKTQNILKFVEPNKVSCNLDIRVEYDKLLDEIILFLNPDIKNSFITIEDKVETYNLIIKEKYAYNRNYLIAEKDYKPTKINFYELGEIEVELEEIETIEIEKDSKVLPIYKLYKIVKLKEIKPETLWNMILKYQKEQINICEMLVEDEEELTEAERNRQKLLYEM